jgi:L-arabinokinase
VSSAARVVFYISGHGLGHASRAIELIGAILARRGDVDVVVRTSVPSWIFDRVRGPRVDIQSSETDTGMAQIDSLRFDLHETARRAAAFYGELARRVDEETACLRELRADLIVADVPPLAVAAAHAAHLPAIVVANFTWDWIYAYYAEFPRLAPRVIETIAGAYAHAVKALRLPIFGGFASLSAVTEDIPFIARRSRRDPAETRRLLKLDKGQLFVLSSFGGYGVDLPYEVVAREGLTVLAPARLPPAGLEYEDLVAAADVVVSKPGYGIVSECIANRTPLLYSSRGRFAEYDVMLQEMPKMLQCRQIEQEALLAGRWRESIEALLAQQAPGERPRVDGAAVASAAILEQL